jgi:peroxiredoxin
MKANTKQSLENQLNDFKKNWSSKVDQSVSNTFQKGIDELIEANIIAKVIKTNDMAPKFSLRDASGKVVSLDEKLKKGRVILTWYRGGWCPYCNLTLREFQKYENDFQKLDAQFIALTPELPDNSLSTKEKNELTFDVLSDIDSKVAKDYGLVFKVTDEVNAFYKKFHDLKDFNGGSGDELPITATYIIEKNGKISFSFVDVDYRKRAEPQEVLNHLLHTNN